MAKNYFEGWYYKHQFKDDTLICIPGIHDEEGVRRGFIQLVFRDQNHYLEFTEDEIGTVSDTCVELGKNIFTCYGIHLDNEWILADLSYGEFKPLRYDIMGPFVWLPRMECSHGVLSLYHNVYGRICWDNEEIKVDGIGYIEKDKGTSFPSEYCWFQSNAFNSEACVLFAMARIPYLGFKFWGHFAVVYDGVKEYRFATYLGAELLQCDKTHLRLKQGSYYLRIKVHFREGVPLKAPDAGSMKRIIHEAVMCEGEIWLYKKSELIFHECTPAASYEVCMND